MSVSRSLHAYRMDRIWLKAPIAGKESAARIPWSDIDCCSHRSVVTYITSKHWVQSG